MSTNSVMIAGVLVRGSLTTSIMSTIFVPCCRVCKILISRRILFFLTEQTDDAVNKGEFQSEIRGGKEFAVIVLTWLQDLDDNSLVVLGVDSFVDF